MKNKILLITFIVIVLIFSFSISCFAAGNNDITTYTIPDININDLLSANNIDVSSYTSSCYYVLYDKDSSTSSKEIDFIIFYYNDPNVTPVLKYVPPQGYNKGYYYMSFPNYNNGYSFIRFTSHSDDLNWSLNSSDSGSGSIPQISLSGVDPIYFSSNIDYSNVNFDEDFEVVTSSGTKLFPLSPANQLTLTPILEKVEMTGERGVLQEIIQILPIVLIVIISLIALRKAFQMLLSFLRNS